ncbi:MAG: hypothetical protein M0P72_09575 [Metallibacterium scheffleri]|uniref:hypothetical protein n=1 Tax=Metallibacterium scheffleri TaxID=993689 RepID=UPI0026F217AF|nr:hypothetical protein [Metallibacterium scheffleri]MCK9367380.1 hypothetical protein [Metallibacterium scheffleri]
MASLTIGAAQARHPALHYPAPGNAAQGAAPAAEHARISPLVIPATAGIAAAGKVSMPGSAPAVAMARKGEGTIHHSR